MEGSERLTRNAFLRRSGAAGAALLGGSLWATGPVAARARRRDPPIRNLVICCQENRSFDHYFGFAPEVQRRGFGPPPGYSQPDAAGTQHPVFHQTARCGARPEPLVGRRRTSSTTAAGWTASTASSGDVAIGYYTAQELPFYYGLFDDPEAALCPTYFASVLGSSAPNHLYMIAGTSGGITTNGPCCLGVLDAARWPLIFDLLDEAGVTWKIYNLLGVDDLLTAENDNSAIFWTPLGRGPAHVRHAGGLPARLPRRHAARRLVGAVGRARRARRAPARGRGDRDGAASSRSSRRCARRRSGRARRTCSPTTSTAASSTTCRRRRSTRSASASGCRCG